MEQGSNTNNTSGNAVVPIQNPLQIPLILEQILKYAIVGDENGFDIITSTSHKKIDKDTLKELRLVNREWCNKVTKLYNQAHEHQSVLRFGVEHQVFYESAISTQLRMKKFIGVMKKSSTIPTSKYSLGAPFFNRNVQSLFTKFLDIVGSSVRNLKLCIPYDTITTFSQIMFKETLQLPQLKHLTIIIVRGVLYGEFKVETYEQIYQLIKLILLSKSPNLSTIHFDMYDHGYEWVDFGKLICMHLPNSVKHLNLHTVKDEDLQLLLADDKSKIQLISFGCNISNLSTVERIRSFLTLQQPSMRNLNLATCSAWRSTNNNDNENLERESQGEELFLKQDWQCFRQLKSLDLREWKNSEHFLLRERHVLDQLQNLTTLYLSKYVSQKSCISSVSNTLRNLQHVHVPFCLDFQATCRAIFKYLINITKLELTFYRLNELMSLLSGQGRFIGNQENNNVHQNQDGEHGAIGIERLLELKHIVLLCKGDVGAERFELGHAQTFLFPNNQLRTFETNIHMMASFIQVMARSGVSSTRIT